jgi:hypothetical protein
MLAVGVCERLKSEVRAITDSMTLSSIVARWATGRESTGYSAEQPKCAIMTRS